MVKNKIANEPPVAGDEKRPEEDRSYPIGVVIGLGVTMFAVAGLFKLPAEVVAIMMFVLLAVAVLAGIESGAGEGAPREAVEEAEAEEGQGDLVQVLWDDVTQEMLDREMPGSAEHELYYGIDDSN